MNTPVCPCCGLALSRGVVRCQGCGAVCFGADTAAAGRRPLLQSRRAWLLSVATVVLVGGLACAGLTAAMVLCLALLALLQGAVG